MQYIVVTFADHEVDDFDQQFLIDAIRDPSYRYGQAFLNKFTGWGAAGGPNPQQLPSTTTIYFEEPVYESIWESKTREKTWELIDAHL